MLNFFWGGKRKTPKKVRKNATKDDFCQQQNAQKGLSFHRKNLVSNILLSLLVTSFELIYVGYINLTSIGLM